MKKFLKFEASWCNTCRQLNRMLKGSDLPIEHIDVDEDKNESITGKYNIRSLPTMVLIDDSGNELARFNGLTPIPVLKEAYETH